MGGQQINQHIYRFLCAKFGQCLLFTLLNHRQQVVNAGKKWIRDIDDITLPLFRY